MRNKGVVLLVTLSVLGCYTSLLAKERRGAELMVTKTDGQWIAGELIAVKPASLLLLDAQSGSDVSVIISHVEDIKIGKEPKTLAGAAIGFFAGAGVGALVGLGVDEVLTNGKDDWFWTSQQSALLGGGIGGLVGGIAGGILGAHRSKTIQIEGKSDSEIKEILEGLRKSARIINTQ